MSIFGECITASEQLAVIVTKLGIQGCNLLIDSANVLPHGELVLWIGAIGPLMITATRCGENIFRAQFEQPLDPRIVDHFSYA